MLCRYSTGIELVCSQAEIEPSELTQIIHGTTLATNLLIERKGAKTALITTEGFRDVIYAVAEANPEWRAEIRDWYDNWIELAAPPIDHSVRLLRALKAVGVPVFSLTNFGVESYAYAQSHYDFLGEFDRDYVSGRMQVIKPDPKIYEMLEQDCGVAPGRLLFADDRVDNIAMAASRGWQTHLFETPQGWADLLVAAGLLTVEQAQ